MITDTKQQSPGHRTAVLERPAHTPGTETETVEDAKPIDDQTDRPTGHIRTIGVALAAIVLTGAGGVLAYRVIDGSPEPTGPADTSHDTAEHQRHLAVEPVANGSPNVDSSDAAEYARLQRLAGEFVPRP